MMDIYRKEIYYTIAFFVLYLLMAHTAPWAILFSIDNSVRVLGFPFHYFAALFLGWFGVLVVSIWWNLWADRLEKEIASDAEHAAQPDGSSASRSAPAEAAHGTVKEAQP